jgi:hypothetical protein
MNGHYTTSIVNPKLSGGMAPFTPADPQRDIDGIKLPKDLQDWADRKHLTEAENRRRWTTLPGERGAKTEPRGLNMAGY